MSVTHSHHPTWWHLLSVAYVLGAAFTIAAVGIGTTVVVLARRWRP